MHLEPTPAVVRKPTGAAMPAPARAAPASSSWFKPSFLENPWKDLEAGVGLDPTPRVGEAAAKPAP